MEKQIKDYLKYYIGCKCKMVKPSYHAVHELHLSSDTLFELSGRRLFYFIEPSTVAEVKPILRRLSSMTEEECINIYTIERDRILHPPTNDHDIRRINDSWKIVRLDHIDTTLFITDNAIVYKVTEEKGKPMIEYTRNQPEIFHYLLSKGFDLFNLIDEGLVIDAETITSK